MKNLKTIASTVALTGILAANSFAGIIVNGNTGGNSPCENTKTGIIVNLTGIIVNFTGALTGIIVNAIDTDTKSTGCVGNQRTGILMSD